MALMCSWERPIGFSIIPLSVCYISSKTRLSSFVSQTLPLEAKTLLISSRPLLKLEESLLMYSIPPPTQPKLLCLSYVIRQENAEYLKKTLHQKNKTKDSLAHLK